VRNVDEIVPFLTSRALLAPSIVLDRGVEVREVSRRNVNMRVSYLDGGGGGYFIKQPNPAEPSSSQTIQHEAAFYAACRSAMITGSVPTLIGVFDDALILDLVDAAGTRDFIAHELANNELVLRNFGCSLGQTLRELHEALSKAPEVAAVIDAFSQRPPWVLDLHRPTPSSLSRLSMANIHLIRTLQQHRDAMAALDALARNWSATSPIHGDLKFDNVLMKTSGPDTALVFVDWELVQRGDRLWDVGSVIHELLLVWVFSMPMGGTSIEALIEQATLPLASIARVTRDMWRAYGEADIRFDHALSCAGARLLQSVFEQGHDAEVMSNHSLALSQLAINLLERPNQAAASLFQISEAS
jgi:hypothetical protein